MNIHDTITIGSLTMTRASLIVAIIGIVIALFLTIFLPLAGVTSGFLMGLIILLGFFIGAYNMNCVVLGQCTTYATILMTVYIIYAVLTIIAISAALFKKASTK